MQTGQDRSAAAAEMLAATMDRIYGGGLTTASGGNLSIRDEDGSIWITPAGGDKGSLPASEVACVGADGTVEDAARPSTELPFHRAVYAARSDLHAIVHAHPTALVAFSVCHRVPDVGVLPPVASLCGSVVTIPYALTGTEQLAGYVGAAFAAGADAALLENHGVVAAGGDLPEAFRRFETLERLARIIVRAGAIGGLRPPRRDRCAAPSRSTPPAGDPALDTHRAELADFARRACRQGLAISGFGTLSVRVDERSFLIVPSDADRASLRDGDLRPVVFDRADTPGDAWTALHQAVYAAHPDVGAVITSIPIGATAFGVTDAPLDTHAMSEAFVVLREVVRVPYEIVIGEPERVAGMISPRHSAALLEHAGVLSVGRSLLEAFDRLEVLEATADALVAARSLGGAVPLAGAAIEELESRFPRGD